VGVQMFEEMGVPPDADFYICGPAAFMSGLVDGLADWGVARDRLYTENFGSGPSMTPGIAASPRRRRISRREPRRSDRLYPLRAADRGQSVDPLKPAAR
jgi:ferredoxin-NADP reductase